MKRPQDTVVSDMNGIPHLQFTIPNGQKFPVNCSGFFELSFLRKTTFLTSNVPAFSCSFVGNEEKDPFVFSSVGTNTTPISLLLYLKLRHQGF